MSSRGLLEGTGILLNSSSCYVYAENFKLLPHSLGKTTIGLNHTHIVLPSIKGILNSSEQTMLQLKATFPIHLQRMDEISSRATSRSHVRVVEVTGVGFDLLSVVIIKYTNEYQTPPGHLNHLLTILHAAVFFFRLQAKKKRMDLAKKFEDATASASCTSVNISSLILNRPYPIVRAKRITKFGSTVLLSIRDSDEQLVQIFLPKRYASVVSDEDIAKINSRSIC